MKFRLRRFTSLLCLFLCTFVPFSFATTDCSCGTHSTGITNYTVEGTNADCCTSLFAADQGSYTTYSQQSNGVWQVDGFDLIDSSQGQEDCCRQGT